MSEPHKYLYVVIAVMLLVAKEDTDAIRASEKIAKATIPTPTTALL